jgi:hypothetical protein
MNRSSIVDVKRRLFAAFDRSLRIRAAERLLDSLSYALITMFKVVQYYSQAMDDKNEALLQMKTMLIQFMGQIGCKRDTFVDRSKRLGFRIVFGNYYKYLVAAVNDLTPFLEIDLPLIIGYDVDMLLDLFRADLVVLKGEILPLMRSLNQVLEAYVVGNKALDTVRIESLSQNLLTECTKLKSILRQNSSLIYQLHSGELTVSTFLVQRNELSLQYITADPVIESVYPPTFTPMNLESFKNTIIADSTKLIDSMISILCRMLLAVQDSLELFFALSDLLEIQLRPLRERLCTNITSAEFCILLEMLHKGLDSFDITISQAASFPDFTIDRLILSKIVRKLQYSKQMSIHIAALIQQIRQPGTELAQFHHRLTIMIGYYSLCALGLDQEAHEYTKGF